MITVEKTNTIKRSNVQSEGKFQIKATGKAFRILSDGLYSDKVKAIIRELSCNAYDAHMEAGNKKPFDIQVPTRLESVFRIRDYGVGLSHNDIINVYTTYFESTKTGSNDYIGCLGLGSKSPFSYVDNFTVISYFNGKKYTYNAFISEDQTPAIALMNTEDTKEHNGLEVTFPVKNSDIHTFRDKMASVFKHFKIKPNFINDDTIKIRKTEYLIKGKRWGVRDSWNSYAIMGNVAYPLDDISVDLDAEVNSLIKSCNIDIEFDIGELEVSASRESLSYTKATIANIDKRAKEIIKEVRAEAGKKIKDCKTLWGARVLANELMNGKYKKLKPILEGQNIYQWNGHKVGTGYVHVEKKMQIGLLAFRLENKWRRSYYHDNKTIRKDYTQQVPTKESIKLFWKDINNGSHVRCKQVIEESKDTNTGEYGIDTVILVEPIDDTNAATVKDLQDLLGIEKIPPVSSIERKKVKSIAGHNPKNAKRVLSYEWDTSKQKYRTPSSYWNDVKVDMEAGGVYVSIDRYKINGEYPDCVIDRAIQTMDTIGENIANMVIIGVKNSSYDKFYDNKKWVTLDEYVRKAVKKFISNHKLSKEICYKKSLDAFSKNKVYRTIKEMKGLDTNQPAGHFVEFVQMIQDEVQAADKDGELQKVIQAMYRINHGVTTKYNIDFNAEWEKVEKNYPLFDSLDNWDINEAALKEYIDMIDERNKKGKKV